MPKSVHKTGIKITVDIKSKQASSHLQLASWKRFIQILITGMEKPNG